MTSTDIDTARETLAAAEAEVDRLRSQLRAALADQASRGVSANDDAPPRRSGAAQGIAEARRRTALRNGTGFLIDNDRRALDGQPRPQTVEDGRAEARRRAARRV